MKQIIYTTTFLILFSTVAFAQINYYDKPYKIPKNAIDLEKSGEQVNVKIGQIVFYQWLRKSDMDSFSISNLEGMDFVERQETYIYSNPKTKEKTTTWQWKAVRKGEAKMEIEDENGNVRVLILNIE